MLTEMDWNTILGLVYERYTQAVERHEYVKGEPNDGSKDWKLFHESRLIQAARDERYWFDLLEKIKKEVK